jgi:hypothetical protein
VEEDVGVVGNGAQGTPLLVGGVGDRNAVETIVLIERLGVEVHLAVGPGAWEY